MLLDNSLADFHFNERHEIQVAASAEVVRYAADNWRPESSFLWRWLMRLRGLGSPSGTLREVAEAIGFVCLAETDEEVVYGVAGRFWSLNERATLVSPRTIEEFRGLSDERLALGVMNLRIEPLPPGGTRLYTETRVRCLGASSRRSFRLYWTLIRPFSGLLRHALLRGIRSEALRIARREALMIRNQ